MNHAKDYLQAEDISSFDGLVQFQILNCLSFILSSETLRIILVELCVLFVCKQVIFVTTDVCFHAFNEGLDENEGLSSLSVVAVGGDGMFSEVMNGMLRYKDGEHRTLKSADKKNIAIGIIPAGMQWLFFFRIIFQQFTYCYSITVYYE